ncbi:aminotransferase classes I and II family protein [Babesia bovis T2Bo]|uniref:Aminotransferase, classes I and II family protein n=1 Tax=Babesia bovis TaxID=5865 RepID=A7AQ14_BABBO|nr:aminotransferase classes I and II family protein [Babesia bovis T2Bo]EDO08648.1 aminotransferase classes I and II family protein [Babesia bovis T2Bo]|eukprot:XP_001612216.1 aminotransferase, classes I and II family protein [Babesia bovis T2Bo]
MSLFNHLHQQKPDANFAMAALAKADTHPNKVDVTIGAYRNEEGRPQLFRAVREAKKIMANDMNEMEEYLPLKGHQGFADAARDLLFKGNQDKESYDKFCQRIVAFHSGSATNAIYTSLLLVKEILPHAEMAYASNPGWSNYERLVTCAGLKYGEYTYYTSVERGVEFDTIMSELRTYKPGSVVILQGCCHNPTGFDLNEIQWRAIRDLMIERELIPLLDIAYLGLGTGDPWNDGYAARIFAEKDMDVFIAQSFSKNMSLYSARIGIMHCLFKSDFIPKRELLVKNLELIGRGRFGAPTRHGAEIAYRLMTVPDLRKMWLDELTDVAHRLERLRNQLRDRIEAKGIPGKWNHLTKQIGMFAYLGISAKAVERMQKEFHIYMMSDARVSVAGLNANNIDYFVDALHTVLTS